MIYYKVGKDLLQVGTAFLYHKTKQLVLQNGTGFAKWATLLKNGTGITTRGNFYYKEGQLL